MALHYEGRIKAFETILSTHTAVIDLQRYPPYLLTQNERWRLSYTCNNYISGHARSRRVWSENVTALMTALEGYNNKHF